MSTATTTSDGDFAALLRQFSEQVVNDIDRRLEPRFAAIDERFAAIDERFTSLDERLVSLEQGQQRLEEGQARLEQGQADLAEGQADLRLRVVRIEGELEQTKAQLGRLEEAHRVGFQKVDARFEVLTRLIQRDELRDPRPRRPPKPRKTLGD